MKRIFFNRIVFFFFILVSVPLVSQPPVPINQSDEHGKKNGFWKIFLTDRTVVTKDSSEAFYCGYNLYFFGVNLSFFGDCKRDKKKASKIDTPGAAGTRGKPVIINGNFKFYDKKGRVILDQTFKDGFPRIFEAFRYNRKSVVNMREIIDFSEKYDDQMGSYCYKMYDGENKLVRIKYFKKKDNTWVFEDGELPVE